MTQPSASQVRADLARILATATIEGWTDSQLFLALRDYMHHRQENPIWATGTKDKPELIRFEE